MASRRQLRPRLATARSTGTLFVVLGALSWLLSRGRDGFDKGLFQGASIALMVLGAYVLGTATFGRGKDDEQLPDDQWLPSRDEH